MSQKEAEQHLEKKRRQEQKTNKVLLEGLREGTLKDQKERNEVEALIKEQGMSRAEAWQVMHKKEKEEATLESTKKLLVMLKPKPNETAEEFAKRITKQLQEKKLVDNDGKLILPPEKA